MPACNIKIVGFFMVILLTTRHLYLKTSLNFLCVCLCRVIFKRAEPIVIKFYYQVVVYIRSNLSYTLFLYPHGKWNYVEKATETVA